MANYPFNNYQQPTFGQPFAPQNMPFANQAQNNFQAQSFTPNATMAAQSAPLQMPGIAGRVVGNVSEITANEVPMDRLGYFPVSDGSVIYVKTWTGDGRINTTEYVPRVSETVSEPQSDPFDVMMERLEAIEAAIADLKPKPRTATKKVATDE